MSNVAYPVVNGVESSVIILKSVNTPDYVNIPGVLINPVISEEVQSAPSNHRKIVDGVIVLKTAEEIESMDVRTPAEKRAEAYVNQCDSYLPTLTSYFLTSDSRYDALKAEWQAKRDAIAALYPDVE